MSDDCEAVVTEPGPFLPDDDRPVVVFDLDAAAEWHRRLLQYRVERMIGDAVRVPPRPQDLIRIVGV